MRDEICYRGLNISLLIDMLPAELSSIVFKQLSCKKAHNILITHFLPVRNKTEDETKREEAVWTCVGEMHFPGQKVTSSKTFAEACSKYKPLLSKALDEILKAIFYCVECIQNFYQNRNEEGQTTIDMSAFKNFETLKSDYDKHYKGGFLPRKFIVDYGDQLNLLCKNVSQLAFENDFSTIQCSDQENNWKIQTFVELFHEGLQLPEVAPASWTPAPPAPPNENKPEKLKRKIWSQYKSLPREIPLFVVDADGLLKLEEDFIYISHLYLTGKWIDEVTLSSHTLLDSKNKEIQDLDKNFINLLPVIGKTIIQYVDTASMHTNYEDNEWLSERTLEMGDEEISKLKNHFRQRAVKINADGTKTPYFMTSYLSDDFPEGGEIHVQSWYSLLADGRTPPWFLDEVTRLDNNIIVSFTLSIRDKILKYWIEEKWKT